MQKCTKRLGLRHKAARILRVTGEDLLRTDPQTNRLLGKERLRGGSHERASSRHVSQLASSRGTNGLSGNALPLEKIQERVKTPSNQSHASAAGSSQGSHPVRSWRHTSGRTSRVNGYVGGILSPSPNLGRNLFPYGVFLRSTKSAGSMAQRDWLTHRALVRCSQPPLWGQTK
jgi:hypothetical protein